MLICIQTQKARLTHSPGSSHFPGFLGSGCAQGVAWGSQVRGSQVAYIETHSISLNEPF